MLRRITLLLAIAIPLALAPAEARRAIHLNTIGVNTIGPSSPQDPKPDPQKKTEPEDDIFKVETNLVVLNVTVTDFGEQYVTGLKEKDFTVYEDGLPQKIQGFSFEEMPFASSILLDSSASMENRLTHARAACARFVEGIREGDVFSIYKFGGAKVKLLQEFTEVRDIPDSVWEMRADSLTPLYDAVVTASEALAKRDERRRAIVLVSDGGDSNSRASLDEAVRQATNAGAGVYAVNLSNAGLYKSAGHDAGAEAMKTLAAKTGGRFFSTPGGQALRDAFDSTVEELRRQYTISYESTNDKQDGKWRKIEVRVGKAGLNVRTRQGYYAAKKKKA
jgi:Ca-activated chloride channel family protein